MIYIHVPFCRSFCTYCDFYSELACKGHSEQAIDAYFDCLCDEMERRRLEIASSSEINTLYIGGGTPSVLPLSAFKRILATLGPSESGKGYSEFTIEVNPEDIVEKGIDYVRGLLSLGVNRVSMGVQSLDDGLLKWMNRRHDSARAMEAFGILREAGVENISLDLIFGISGLTPSILEKTIDKFIGLGPEHISAYQLSIEDGSSLAKMLEDGRYTEADDEQCRAQYGLICARLAEAGYRHYEISNWSRPGCEAKHNSAYWTRAPYVGLGPAAHSLCSSSLLVCHPELVSGTPDLRSWNSSSLSDWTSDSETLSGKEIREEQIMLGLRTARGISETLLETSLREKFMSEGLLVPVSDTDEPRVRIPEHHFFISDDIISGLI